MIGEPYNTIGNNEQHAIWWTMERAGWSSALPLSDYLAGKPRGGEMVCALEDAWCETFHVKHAIAVNSATSGLLAAAFAVGLGPGDRFVCPAMTMSATAAAPMFTGATPVFVDVDDETFSIPSNDLPYNVPVFATNLFGHPADLRRLRQWCDLNKTYLIEDNAQSPFARAEWGPLEGLYAGTIGHIGVWSLNVHKHFHCGEGGICTTDDDGLAARLRAFINHGEHVSNQIGLNLRMPEVCATIATVQLRRGEELVWERVEQAEAILAAIGDIPGIRKPVVRDGCTHVYYTIPFLLDEKVFAGPRRSMFCSALRGQGVPIVEGYVEPLYRMPAFAKFARPCPVAEDLHDRRLFYIENCAWTFTKEQIAQIGDAFRKAAELL